MAKYRKKPVVIEAVQWTGDADSYWSIRDFCPNLKTDWKLGNDMLIIETLEGDMQALNGDFIIKGVQGEFYPCKPDTFEATYEEVED